MLVFVAVLSAALFLVAVAGLYIWTRLRPRRIRAEVEIDASAELVWEVLTDFSAYPEWNPFIVKATGQPSAGEKLRVELSTGSREMSFAPTVLVAEPERELRWIGRFGVPGVMDGEHYFSIERIEDGRVRFIHGETFTGVLVPFVGRALDVEGDFTAMNAALKDRVEKMRR
ncbi:SRPBCC domain-containing protein [Nocardiopsis rhodophaea]|uniref:SRPBCC domain-containing protein n=1 Tax=Nocardiopsis rhodophaea TaxID=280238 RepID=A0ABP5DRG9_9ACTN